MNLSKSIETVHCFSLNAAFGTCVGYAAFGVSQGILNGVAKISGTDISTYDIASIAAPVGMMIALNSVARMAGELGAPKHKAYGAIAGGVAAFAVTGYMAVFNEGLFAPPAPKEAMHFEQLENVQDAYRHQMFKPL